MALRRSAKPERGRMKPTIETVVYAAVKVSYVSPVAAEHVDCAIVTIMASERLRFVSMLYRSYYKKWSGFLSFDAVPIVLHK